MIYQTQYNKHHMKKKIRPSFSDKIKHKKKAILYELLPPARDVSEKDIESSILLFSKIIQDFSVDAINIPEVREESRNGTRTNSELVKLEPRMLCTYLKTYTSAH